MIKFKNWAPTSMDDKGVGSEGQEDWLVLPTARTRDTGPLEESNFASALKSLGGESDTVQVHRFGHWGPGWVEIIVVHPSRRDEAEEIEKSLEDYPVLDEEDMSQRETDAADEDWKGWGESEFKSIIKKNFELDEEQDDMLDFVDLADLWREVANELSWSEQHDGHSTNFNFEEAEKYLSEHPDLVWDAIDEAYSSPEYVAGQKKSEDDKLDRWHKATRGYNPRRIASNPLSDEFYGPREQWTSAGRGIAYGFKSKMGNFYEVVILNGKKHYITNMRDLGKDRIHGIHDEIENHFGLSGYPVGNNTPRRA